MPERVFVVSQSALEFFRAEFGEAMTHARVSLGPFTEFYVVNLLVRQIHDAYHPDETLADRYCRAASAGPAERVRLLREVGDTALVVCGLWCDQEFRPRHELDMAYHAAMGQQAYALLSHDDSQRVQNFGLNVFGELCERFHGLVGALTHLGTKHSLATARGIVQLFERWQKTGSRHAARALAKQGIMVGTTGSEKKQ